MLFDTDAADFHYRRLLQTLPKLSSFLVIEARHVFGYAIYIGW